MVDNQNFKFIPANSLFVSEPNPSWFGNSANESNNSKWSNKNWLKSRFHFAFAENTNGPREFGVLRVMNDDLVQPDRGFGTHGHQNVEICTYIIRGQLTHQDSTGTAETLGRGSIQFMTAGSGVQHSEHNLNKENDLRFIQMWITTRQRNLPPNYGSYAANKDNENLKYNKFQHLVTDVNNKNSDVPIKINQDANIYVSQFDKEVEFQVLDNRQVYILQMEGDSTCLFNQNESQQFIEQDAATAKGPLNIKFQPNTNNSHILIVEMKKQ